MLTAIAQVRCHGPSGAEMANRSHLVLVAPAGSSGAPRMHNYYVVRANALEDNVVLYKTVDGVRKSLDTVGRMGGYGVNTAVPANQWHACEWSLPATRFKTSTAVFLPIY